jgi:hypothetical protein
MGIYLVAGVSDLNTDEKIPEGLLSKITSTAACGSAFAGRMVSTAGRTLLRATSRFMIRVQVIAANEFAT